MVSGVTRDTYLITEKNPNKKYYFIMEKNDFQKIFFEREKIKLFEKHIFWKKSGKSENVNFEFF